MSVTATYAGEWEVQGINCELMYRNIEDAERNADGSPKTEDVTDPETSTTKKVLSKVFTYQKREHYVLTARRRIVDLLAFKEDVGNTANQFTMAFKPNATQTYTSGNRVWVCTNDRLQVNEFIVGEYVQEQTWEYYSPWADTDLTEFEP